MKPLQRLLALFLTILIATAPVQAADTSPILPQPEHLQLSLTELDELTFSLDSFTDLSEDLQKAGRTGDQDQVSALLPELKEQYMLQDTKLTMLSIRSAQDVTDQAASDAYMRAYSDSYQVERIMNDTIVALLDGPCASLVDQEDPVFSMFLWETDSLGPEEEDLYYAEQALVDDYYLAANGPFTAEINGTTYTEDELYEAYYTWQIDDDAFDQASTEIAMAQNAALAPIYLELVENRKAQAALYGADNFSDYQDQYYYFRDYDAEDIAAFASYIKQYIVPVADELYYKVQNDSNFGKLDDTFTEAELLTHLERGISSISPELLPTLHYMEEYGYYDITRSETKSAGAFTMLLSYPHAPFLFMQPEDDSYDFSTIVHEFGHCNAAYCATDEYAFNLDLSEIHSQGLELLMLDQYEDVFGAHAKAQQRYTMYQILVSLIDGCMMDELERFAYSQENLTVDQLNEKYMALLKDYGYRDMDDPETQGYGWVTVSHLFENPLYYISYATSAGAAIRLWEQSLSDRTGAIDTYLRLVALGEGGDFYDTLNQVNLGNPMTARAVYEMAAAVAETYNLSMPTGEIPQESSADQPLPSSKPAAAEGPDTPLHRPEEQAETGSVRSVAIPYLVGIVSGGLVVGLILRRKRSNKRHDETGT